MSDFNTLLLLPGVPGDSPIWERLDSVLLPFILKWTGTESRMACRYFSCSRLLEDSEDEVVAATQRLRPYTIKTMVK